MKTFVEAIYRLPEADREAIRERGGEWLEPIANAGPLEWLPFAANLDLTRAVAAVLGPRRTHEFFVSLTAASFQTTLMRGLVNTVVAVVGHDPGRYLDWMQKGFGLLFRDFGTWTILERGPMRAVIEVVGLPCECFDDDVWTDSVSSSFHALFTIAECTGAVTIPERDPAHGRARFRLTWTK
jgi:hypothetical protein